MHCLSETTERCLCCLLSKSGITCVYLQEYACNNPNSVFGTDIPRCIKWYRENSAVLNVFYDGLDFEKNTEAKAYTVSYS